MGPNTNSLLQGQTQSSTSEAIYFEQDFFSQKLSQFKYKNFSSPKQLVSSKTPNPKSIDWEKPDKAIFENYFKRAQQHFLQQNIKKIVPVIQRKSRQDMSFEDFKDLLYFANQNRSNLYLYARWDFQNTKEFIIGLSPEVLIEQKNNQLNTYAVAGTATSKDQAQGLLNDPKELEEHRFVIDALAETFKNYGKTLVHKTKVIPAARNLYHLYTPIEAQTSTPAPFTQLVNQLHPSPALGTYPTKYWEELKNFGPQEERFQFGAPLGITTTEHSIAIVAIRNLIYKNKYLYLNSGCGLIQESQLEKEWLELQAKQKNICQLLGVEF